MRPHPSETVILTCQTPLTLVESITRVARERDETRSQLIRRALRRELKRLHRDVEVQQATTG